MIWILTAITVIAVLFFLMLLLGFLGLNVAFGRRCEGNPDIKYYTAEDYDDLEALPVAFRSDKGQTLRGAVYTCRDTKPTALVIFAHGMGGGHLSYTTDIRTIAKAGFAVLAYDNTGTMASDGKALGSFYQAVKDLRAALEFAGRDERLSSYKIVLAGHSWGGYTVCQALAFAEERVKGVVAFSPPESIPGIMCDSMRQMLGIPMGWMRPAVWIASVIQGGWRSRRRCSSVLLKTGSVPIMILHGDADTSVSLNNSPLSCSAVTEKENITAILYEGKAHNVYQTKESEKYLMETFAAIGETQKRYGKKGIPEEEKARLYGSIDYELIVREDGEVMKTVTDFIRNCVNRS